MVLFFAFFSLSSTPRLKLVLTLVAENSPSSRVVMLLLRSSSKTELPAGASPTSSRKVCVVGHFLTPFGLTDMLAQVVARNQEQFSWSCSSNWEHLQQRQEWCVLLLHLFCSTRLTFQPSSLPTSKPPTLDEHQKRPQILMFILTNKDSITYGRIKRYRECALRILS